MTHSDAKQDEKEHEAQAQLTASPSKMTNTGSLAAQDEQMANGSEEELSNRANDDDDDNTTSASGEESESGSSEDEGEDEEEDEGDGEDDEAEDDDDEPALKYERITGTIPDLLKKDSASALAVSNKTMVHPHVFTVFCPNVMHFRLWVHMQGLCTYWTCRVTV